MLILRVYKSFSFMPLAKNMFGEVILLIMTTMYSQAHTNLIFTKHDFPVNPLSKENYVLALNDDFITKNIDLKNWIPYYLPHWSSKEMTKPNYEIKAGNLTLKITEEQKPWCPEFNGEVKCSSIQTGLYSGKLGTAIGQHKVSPACIVREQQKTTITFLQQYGYFEIRAKALYTKSNVVALWMIGFEDSPEKSAEICIFEVKGSNVNKGKATIGYGIRKFKDDKLTDDFHEDDFKIDVLKFHIYAAEWTPEKVIFYIDNQKTRELNQSPKYPMQFMLGIYEIPSEERDIKDETYPKEFIVDYVRGYKRK